MSSVITGSGIENSGTAYKSLRLGIVDHVGEVVLIGPVKVMRWVRIFGRRCQS